MSTRFWTLVAGSWLAACGAAPPAQSPSAAGVELSWSAPPAGYVKVGLLAVVSGKGCGVMGSPGSAEAARALMQNEAAKHAASYVQLTSVEKPPINHQCQEHEHKLSGVAYRKPAVAPVPPATAPSPTPVAAPAAAP